MADKIRFDYAEAQVQMTCAVCSEQFMAFPDSDKSSFSCPRCDRTFEFTYSIKALNSQEILRQRLKDEQVLKR